MPEDDPYLKVTDIRCLNFSRAETFQDSGCTPEIILPEQVSTLLRFVHTMQQQATNIQLNLTSHCTDFLYSERSVNTGYYRLILLLMCTTFKVMYKFCEFCGTCENDLTLNSCFNTSVSILSDLNCDFLGDEDGMLI